MTASDSTSLIAMLKAAGEPTRLRILMLLDRAELTVSDLTRILGQSQPRVSRHLKLMCDAALLERTQEGSWAFYRTAHRGPPAAFIVNLLECASPADPVTTSDLERLADVQREHAEIAGRYFRENAPKWDQIRRLYVGESQVESAMLELAGDGKLEEFLDVGTGTGRILQVFSARVGHGVGIDSNREMLSVARSNLERAGVKNCQVRHGDIYHPPIAHGTVDLVAIHHVLHFLEDPEGAIDQAVRLLRPGGRVILVDFARHDFEFLRTDYAHRRLGFTDIEVLDWCRRSGLEDLSTRHLAAGGVRDEPSLTVTLWTGTSARDQAAARGRLVA